MSQNSVIFIYKNCTFRQNRPRADAIPNDPQRDPVHLYRTYQEKRPKSMMTEEAPFFLSPCTASHKGWFKKTPLGINKLYNIINEMKCDAGIDDSRIKPYRYIIKFIKCLHLAYSKKRVQLVAKLYELHIFNSFKLKFISLNFTF